MAKTKLELTWIGKDKRPRLEPRILLEDPEKSYHAKRRVSGDDIFDNCHFNAVGSRTMAEVVAAFLEAKGLVFR